MQRSRSGYDSDLDIGTAVATLPGVRGPVLGLVGPVSVHCDLGKTAGLKRGFYVSLTPRRIV